jgi:hypothetical protein
MRAEYSSGMRCIVVAVAVFVLLALPTVAQMNSHGGAAIHGVPPSVTSFGFGGHPRFHGVPPSVTSLNFGNIPIQLHRGPFGHRHHDSGFVNPFFGGAYYVPYAVPYDYSDYYVMSPGVDDTMEEDYARPGPTIFDSHGASSREYARPGGEEDYRSRSEAEAASAKPAQEPEPQQPPEDQPTTVLVFKDGRQMEVENYVIAGSTLYDLSEGRSKKVALAELDLPATVKQNDDRGVEFKIPADMKLN